jgi:hypothetical protein
MLLAIANPRIDDDIGDSSAANERIPLRVVTRRDGVTPARRFARPAMEARTVVREEEAPPRSPIWKSWWRHRRNAIDHGSQTRLRGILASPDARFVAGTVACSLAFGLFIAHLSV